MEIVLYLLLGLALTWIVFMVYLWTSSKSLQGKKTDALRELLPALADYPEQVILYCFTPSCGPCRRMTPTIDKMIAAGEPILKVDISQALDIAQELQVRAAPTLMLIRHDVIEQVEIGARSRDQLAAMLAR
jgi:thiol-disulfide isomerase/thioredoxin